MPEKLLNLKEASLLLGISEEEIQKLVKKGEIPAYEIGGAFLRFRKEQLEAIADAIRPKTAPPPPRRKPVRREEDLSGESNFLDRILDFIYFSDFYIISVLLIIVMVYVIFKP